MAKTSNNPAPSATKTAFACPHCNVLTTQYWFKLFAEQRGENRTPNFPRTDFKEGIQGDEDMDPDLKKYFLNWAKQMDLGHIFFDTTSDAHYLKAEVQNLNISLCYSCEKYAVWVHENLTFPRLKTAPLVNSDMPDEISSVFEEARAIVEESPRGAAALLRLCVQMLCKHLGESGENINDDIASLVKKGLNPLVQQSLDIVRVVGNNAVHPGEIQLNDDRSMAISLFGLINSIVDQMITHPNNVKGLFSALPQKALEGIEKRDRRVSASAPPKQLKP